MTMMCCRNTCWTHLDKAPVTFLPLDTYELYLAVFKQNAGTDKSVFPLPEPQDVFLAAQVRFDELNRDLRQFGRDLTSTSCLNSDFSLHLKCAAPGSQKDVSRTPTPPQTMA